MRTYDRRAKRRVLVLWVTFSVIWVGAMASPLYLLRDKLATRPSLLILLPMLFAWTTWLWLKIAIAVGRQIKNLPVEPR